MEKNNPVFHLPRRQFLKAGGVAGLAVLGSSLFDGKLPSVLAAVPAQAASDKWINTACWIGKQGCVMQAHVVDGVVTDLRGHPDDPRTYGRLCLKGQAQLMSMYDPYRVKAPLVRTNAKGEHGQWKEVSWDEALTLVGQKLKEVRTKDINRLIIQLGGAKQGMAGRYSLVGALGTSPYIGSSTCFSALGDANAYTTGFNSGLQADLRYTDYLLIWGSSLKDGGPSGLCWTTWQNHMRQARERGMKAVLIDPRREAGANLVDDWLPIRPSSDLAMFLAIANVLISRGYVDKPFLTRQTNSAFLLKPDGHFIKKDGKELVWDTNSKSAQPFDRGEIAPALEGTYTVEGTPVKTVFEALKEHIATTTPEWAADICGLPAYRIRQVALDLGKHARIGSTIVVDGINLPYRPVGMMAYHGLAQQEMGFQTGRAANIVWMLLGAFHSVGGVRIGQVLGVDPMFKNLDTIKILDKPKDIKLTNTKYFPISLNLTGTLPYHVMANAAKYDAEAFVPEVMLTVYGNPFLSGVQSVVREALMNIKFMASIESHVTEELDYLADVILPAATMDKLDGLVLVRSQYDEGMALRLPPVAPLYQSKADTEIYIAICEKAGVLYGKGGFIDRLNTELGLKEPHLLDVNKKPEVREVYDTWAKSQGLADGIRYFEEKGLTSAPIPAKRMYAAAWDPPYGGIKYRVYGESLLGYQEQMKQKGVDKVYWQDYTPLPIWRESTMNQSPVEYDLYFIDYKSISNFHSQASLNPILHEQNPEQKLQMNSRTAAAKGFKDGDWVWVESHNAVSKETRKVRVRVQLLEGMRPDTVGMYHGFGHWVHPVAKGSGPAGSELFFTGEGYTATPSGSTVCRVKVKVTRA